MARHNPSKDLKGKQTRERILQVSAHLLANASFSGTSLDDIAKAANVTKGAIYSHFSSKNDVLYALLAKFGDEYIERAIRILAAQSENTLIIFDELLDFATDYLERNVELYSLAIIASIEWKKDQTSIGPRVKGLFDNYRKSIANLFAQGQKGGIFRKDLESSQLTETTIAWLNGAAMHIHQNKGRIAASEFFFTSSRLLKQALIADHSSNPGLRLGSGAAESNQLLGTFIVGCPSLGNIDLDPSITPSGGPY